MGKNPLIYTKFETNRKISWKLIHLKTNTRHDEVVLTFNQWKIRRPPRVVKRKSVKKRKKKIENRSGKLLQQLMALYYFVHLVNTHSSSWQCFGVFFLFKKWNSIEANGVIDIVQSFNSFLLCGKGCIHFIFIFTSQNEFELNCTVLCHQFKFLLFLLLTRKIRYAADNSIGFYQISRSSSLGSCYPFTMQMSMQNIRFFHFFSNRNFFDTFSSEPVSVQTGLQNE